MTVQRRIEAALGAAARQLGVEGELPDFEVVRSRNPAHGEYASAPGLKLAGRLRRAPHDIARELAGIIEVEGGVVHPEAVGGYVNFRYDIGWLQRLVAEVAAAGEEYGRSDMGADQSIQVEFASINPTGPLHIGHGRGAILGDSLCRVLAFTGHRVDREYYVNDFGTQALKFGQSLVARRRGEAVPEGGYAGEYVTRIAKSAVAAGVSDDVDSMMAYGTEAVLAEIRSVMASLGVRYDHWFSERSLWEGGLAQAAIERLREGGFLRDRDGATWFVPALETAVAAEDEALDVKAGAADATAERLPERAAEPEEERVVFRTDGRHTYFASDLGYLLDRLEVRSYDRVIEVWGADHHGYVARFKSGAEALGLDPERLTVILNQMVSLREGRMSKRSGTFVTLEELVQKAGVDAVRYFYLTRSPDSMMEFDLELALEHSRRNPVYYVQYAHARLCAVERKADEMSLTGTADMSLLQQSWELDVARMIAHWPEVVEEAAVRMEPHRVPYYLNELADRISAFYEAGNEHPEYRVLVADGAVARTRVELCRAARATLRSGLALVGVEAPERMDRLESEQES